MDQVPRIVDLKLLQDKAAPKSRKRKKRDSSKHDPRKNPRSDYVRELIRKIDAGETDE